MTRPAVVILALAIGSGAAAQDPPRDQQPRTTFRSSVDLVPVDVNVVDKDGRPVADLGARRLLADG